MHRLWAHRLVRDEGGADRFTLFLVAAVVTILVTRAFLHLTDYPQVGAEGCTSRTCCGAVSGCSPPM